ncbi:3'-5'-exoribonuclease family protein [Trifolium repens]|nr:3'-5'-exoribonuclease family protein [Trifolium repens]
MNEKKMNAVGNCRQSWNDSGDILSFSPTTAKKKPALFKEDSTRPDGREFHQCRPAFFRTGAVNAASGSAYAEFGNTKVIVSVFGPRESKKAMMYSDTGRLNCNVSYTTFATPVIGQGSDHKEYSSILHKALEGAIILESFPKTTVDVFALVLQSSGSDLPVVISCASLALADAGILMYDLVASVSVSCLGKNLVIDPISEEENSQDGSLMITCLPSRYEITQLTVTGEWSTPKINEGMQLCLDACAKLAKIMRSCLKESSSDAQGLDNESS